MRSFGLLCKIHSTKLFVYVFVVHCCLLLLFVRPFRHPLLLPLHLPRASPVYPHDRYGPKVLYETQLEVGTVALWTMPLLVIPVGVFMMLRRRR